MGLLGAGISGGIGLAGYGVASAIGLGLVGLVLLRAYPRFFAQLEGRVVARLSAPKPPMPDVIVEPSPDSVHRQRLADRLALRCERSRCDQGTLDLAHAIAGTPESMPVREKVLRLLYSGTPRQELLVAIQALYCDGLPPDVPTLRRHTRQVAEIAVTTHRAVPRGPDPRSFLLYTQGMSELLASHLRASPTISDSEVRECSTLVSDLRQWGFTVEADWIEQQLPAVQVHSKGSA